MVHDHRPIRSEVSTFHVKSLCSAKHHQECDGANDRGYIDPIRNGDAFDTTGYSDPFVRWEGHSGKVP